jgi:hypothetical protein
MQFHHVGVPTREARPNESYVAAGKVFITDPDASPYKFEYLRFEPGSPMPVIMQTKPHIAYMVEDLAAALVGQEVIVPPFDANPALAVAFIVKDNIVVELMQAK